MPRDGRRRLRRYPEEKFGRILQYFMNNKFAQPFICPCESWSDSLSLRADFNDWRAVELSFTAFTDQLRERETVLKQICVRNPREINGQWCLIFNKGGNEDALEAALQAVGA